MIEKKVVHPRSLGSVGRLPPPLVMFSSSSGYLLFLFLACVFLTFRVGPVAHICTSVSLNEIARSSPAPFKIKDNKYLKSFWISSKIQFALLVCTDPFLQPNGFYQGNETETRRTLATYADHIQIGLAGNLKDYVLISQTGEARKGSEIRTFDGSPVGYASSPIETINYASAHDNETLFDIISLKTPMNLSIDERCRINHLSTSMIALSQGIPFFHAGDEILRSKSLDRDSYNSGDWFNKIDFTYETNNWGVGLPPREKNEGSWPLMKPRLENPSFKPAKCDIIATLDKFVDILKIRYSSPLFRLTTASDIEQRVHFHNTGPSSVPGVIVMSIDDARNDRHEMAQIDKTFSCVVTVFNVCPHEVSIEIPDLASLGLQLHPVQVNSSDALVRQSAYEATTGRFTVPKRTTAVFVEPRC